MKHSLRPYRKICSKRLSNPRRFSQVPHIGTRLIFLRDTTAPMGPGSPQFRCFTITLRHTTLGRIPLDESARCRNLYLTKYNTHKKEIFRHPAGFKPAVSASERPQTHALVWAATRIGIRLMLSTKQNITFL